MLLRVFMPIIGIMMLMVIMASAGPAPGPTQPAPQSQAKVFHFLLQKGQYTFIGRETGTKGKGEMDQGVDPIARLRILPNTKSATWELRVTVQPVVDKNGENVWKWEVVWRYGAPDGSMHPRFTSTWQDTIPRDKKAEAVPIEMVDASKEKGVEGLQLYKFPYAKVDDETYYVIIAIADKTDLFPKAISVPKKYIIWNWGGNWPSFD